MKTIRVFPRKNNATPDDENARFSEPGLFDIAESVRVSVTFTEDKSRGEELAEAWSMICNDVTIVGPAYDDPGDEFTPGLYVKYGYTMTSRGCPNHCWFCKVPKREGVIRELKIQPGYNVLDSNLLACSEDHIKSVFKMLAKQHHRPRFTGGLEAARMKPWIAEELKKLNPTSAFFAYDEPADYEPLVAASRMMADAGILPDSGRAYWCYVLVGYKGDTFEAAEKRFNDVLKLKLMPMAMLFDKKEHREKKDGWIAFQREWANHIIVGKKYSKYNEPVKN
jgi:hypothetical protein